MDQINDMSEPEKSNPIGRVPENNRKRSAGISGSVKSKRMIKKSCAATKSEIDQMYKEKLEEIDRKISAVKSGNFTDVKPLQELQKSHREKIESITSEMNIALASAQLELEAKNLKAKQDYENDIERLRNRIREDIEMQILDLMVENFRYVNNLQSESN